MKKSLNKASLIDFILMLRGISIIIQISLLCFVQLVLLYELPWLPLLIIIAVEIAFNLICYMQPHIKNNTSRAHIFIQLLADVIFLGCLLLFSGGATNAFVSLLLIPIAIAAICLPIRLLTIVTFCAVATYSYLLHIMPMHEMHGNIEGHFVAMWLNFIFSAAVVSVVISRMAKTISANKLQMATYREEQLKQEQIIALGVASTQVTHDLATPISSIRILLDELNDEFNEELTAHGKEYSDIKDLLKTLDSQVSRCSDNLTNFRNITLDIKNNTQKPYVIIDLLQQVKNYSHLAYPEHHLSFITSAAIKEHHTIWADSSLLPALINVIDNAVKFSDKTSAAVTFTSNIINDALNIIIKDTGKGFSVNELANQATPPTFKSSDKEGLGIALLLSNSSVERLKGKISISNQPQGGAEVTITFPLFINNT